MKILLRTLLLLVVLSPVGIAWYLSEQSRVEDPLTAMVDGSKVPTEHQEGALYLTLTNTSKYPITLHLALIARSRFFDFPSAVYEPSEPATIAGGRSLKIRAILIDPTLLAETGNRPTIYYTWSTPLQAHAAFLNKWVRSHLPGATCETPILPTNTDWTTPP